jgi:hypothetical protein
MFMDEQGVRGHFGTVVGRIAAALAAIVVLGAFSASSAEAAAPANDNFSAAKELTGHPVSQSGTTRQATREAGEPDHGDSDLGSTVWYRWTPDKSGTAIIEACDDNDYVEGIAVYSGTSLADLDEKAEGYCSVSTPVTSGGSYWIAVGSYSDWTGPFTLHGDVIDPPANDNFEAAEEIIGTSVTGTTAGSSREAGEPDHFDYAESSVWYSWTPSESGTAALDACDYDNDYVGGVYVYTGSALDSLTKVGEGYCQATFQATAGTTYRIAVLGWDSYGGEFTLSAQIIHPPENDNFASAATITGSSVTGTTVGATSELGEPDHDDEGTDATVWYEWTASQSGTAIFDACNGDYSVEAIAVYTGTSLGSLTKKASGYCQVAFQATAGTTYRLALGSYSSYWGEFTLDLTTATPPANDNFASSQAITALPVTGTTLGATSESGEPDHDYTGATATVWYRLGFTQTATYHLKACDENGTIAAIAVYAGTSMNNLVRRGSGECDAYVQFEANVIYRVALASYPGEWGSFSLSVPRVLAPANDDFENAVVLDGDSASANGHTYSSTRQAGEKNHAGKSGTGSVWYSWTPSESGHATIQLCGQFDSVLGVYTGGSVADLADVTSDDDSYGEYCDYYSSVAEFHATSGTTYRIAVDGDTDIDRGFFTVYADLDPDPAAYGLSVTRSGDGSGTISSAPSGISCGSACSASFEDGTKVTLQATPASGSTFAGWSGACSGSDTCEVTMSEARSVEARFNLIPPPVRHDLNVKVSGTGSGTVTGIPGISSCSSICNSTHDEGTRITLTATADSGSDFAGWGGACTGTGTCVVDLSAEREVTATFDRQVIPPDDPAFSPLTLTPAKLKVNAGKKGKVKVQFANVGGLPVLGASLCLKVPGKFKKLIKPQRCSKFSSVKPGSTWLTTVTFKTTAKAKGKAKLKVTLSASNATSVSANVTVTIKPKKKRRH